MPKTANIPLSEDLLKKIESAMVRGRYTSKNKFFSDLLQLWKEEQVLKELAKSQREIASGKGKVLNSLKDLR